MKMAWRKAELTRQLRDYVQSIDPQMGIGIELLTDVSASQCDFIHSLFGSSEVDNDWEKTGEKPIFRYFIDWFRYCFPEIIMTDRTIRDDTDIPRRVNLALLKGLRSDVEIYRCRKTIKETPHYEAYLKQANELRDRFAEFLMEGRYVDTLGFTCDNDQVEARAFVNGNRMAVLATQSHLAHVAATISVPGYDVVEHGGLGQLACQQAGGRIQLDIPRHALAVVVLQRTA
jgi:hypothetical protein